MSIVHVYTRVSTNHQSQESQKLAIAKYLSNCQDKVVMLEDTASGRKDDRPGYLRLKKGVQDGSVKTVVVWRQNRLGRSFLEMMKMMQLCRDKGVRIVSLTENLDPDTPHGRLMSGIIACMDEFFTEQQRENTLAGLEVARSKGRRLGSDRTQGKTWITKKNYERVNTIKKMADAGCSIYAIAKACNMRWGAVKYIVDTPRHLIRTKKMVEDEARKEHPEYYRPQE